MTDDEFEARWAERQKEREAIVQRWLAREGLEEVGVVPLGAAIDAVAHSLLRVDLAMRVVEEVIELLGDRAYRDVLEGDGDHRLVFLRDAEDPRWILPFSFIDFDADALPPEPLGMPDLALPERVQRKVDEEMAKRPPVPERPRILPGPVRRAGRLRIAEGPAYVEIQYGADGTRKEQTVCPGDSFTWGHYRGDKPVTIDPLARPRPKPPFGLYLRADLDPMGHPPEVMARMIAELDPARHQHGRVYLPFRRTPGGAGGGWHQGLHQLRPALWEGRVGDADAGWVVCDTWNGSVIVVGEDRESAFAAWTEAVRRVQPLPPPPPAAPPPMPDVPDEPPSSHHDETTGTTTLSTGTIRIAIGPRVLMDWPEARPENVPAIAVRLPPLPEVPEAWAAIGFDRRVRLVGDYGEVSSALLRRDEGGFTLVGEDAVPALDPRTFDADIAAADAARMAEMLEFPYERAPWEEYPVETLGFRVWDDYGRAPRLRAGGTSWGGEGPNPKHMDGDELRWVVTIVRPARPF